MIACRHCEKTKSSRQSSAFAVKPSPLAGEGDAKRRERGCLCLYLCPVRFSCLICSAAERIRRKFLKQFAKLAAITAFKEAAQTLQIDIQKFPAHKPRSLGGCRKQGKRSLSLLYTVSRHSAEAKPLAESINKSTAVNSPLWRGGRNFVPDGVVTVPCPAFHPIFSKLFTFYILLF